MGYEGISKLGLVAGADNLPLKVIEYCKNNKIELFSILVTPFADEKQYQGSNFMKIKIGQVGKAMDYLQKNGVKDIVFAGRVKKPSFCNIRIDFKGFLLLKKILASEFRGDNAVLEVILKFLDKYGFNVLEIDKLLGNELKFNKGFNSVIKCDENILKDIVLGKKILDAMSPFDIGQSIVVQQGNVIGIECVEGTEKLIDRCNLIKFQNGSKPVLIKAKKIDQSRKIDLPAIGIDTVMQLKNAGFCGMAVDSENCIIIEKQNVIRCANENEIFIYGL